MTPPLTPEQWLLAEPIIDRLLELDESDRSAALVEACPDAALRAAIARVLQGGARSARVLDGDAEPLAGALRPNDGAEREPERIGPYRVIRELARGGMGVVLLAERDDGQFTQRVALKLIRHGMGSEEIHARFLRERQILARLSHPNIARLLDGGLDPDEAAVFRDGVRGWRNPITSHCRSTVVRVSLTDWPV
ncbi:MAG: protein kinase [Gemmatimonadaceae bacterium]